MSLNGKPWQPADIGPRFHWSIKILAAVALAALLAVIALLVIVPAATVTAPTRNVPTTPRAMLQQDNILRAFVHYCNTTGREASVTISQRQLVAVCYDRGAPTHGL